MFPISRAGRGRLSLHETFCFPGGRLLLRGPGHSPVVRGTQSAVRRSIFLKLFVGSRNVQNKKFLFFSSFFSKDFFSDFNKIVEGPKYTRKLIRVPNPVKQAAVFCKQAYCWVLSNNRLCGFIDHRLVVYCCNPLQTSSWTKFQVKIRPFIFNILNTACCRCCRRSILPKNSLKKVASTWLWQRQCRTFRTTAIIRVRSARKRSTGPWTQSKWTTWDGSMKIRGYSDISSSQIKTRILPRLWEVFVFPL